MIESPSSGSSRSSLPSEQRKSIQPSTEPLRGIVERVGFECASHDIYAAPGMLVFVQGMWSGRKQTLAIDPEEIDELCKRLHQAKRYSRRDSPHAGRLPEETPK